MSEAMNALRRLARAPWFALSAIVLFALGIGANAAIVGALRFLFLSPLPLPDADRLVGLWQTSGTGEPRAVAPGNFLDWRRDARSFSSLSSYFEQSAVLVGAGEPARLEVAEVSRDFFRTLGATPLAGRLALAADQTTDRPLVVLGEELWRTRLGGAPVAGRLLEIDGRQVEVLGVAPRSVAVPPGVALWKFAPRDVAELRIPGVEDSTTLRNARYLGVVGRLGATATLEGARAEMRTIADRLEREFPEDNRDTDVLIDPLAKQYAGGAARPLRLLAVASGLILALTCMNLAGLFLARGAQRERELALRSALGASPRRLRLEILAESLWLAAFGGGLGLALAVAGRRALVGALPDVSLAGRQLGLDAGSLAISLLLTVGAALAAGLLPAWRSARVAPRQALSAARGGLGRQGVALRRGLVAGQAALALALLVGAGLLVRSLERLESVRLGIEPRGAWSARLTFPSQDPSLDRAQKRNLLTELVARAAGLPGVVAAGGSTRLPFAGCGPSSTLRVDGLDLPEAERPDTCWRSQVPGTFRALGARLIAGREFGGEDHGEAPQVAIVNRTLALWLAERRGLPEVGGVLGMRISTGLDGEEGTFVTVVGVVDDLPQGSPDLATLPEIYRPWEQSRRWGVDSLRLIVRGPMPSDRELRALVAGVSPRLAIDEVRSLADVAAESNARPRLVGRLLGAFAAVALLLAAIGLHGLLALLVTERRREIGIRLALGARRAEIVRRTLGWGLTPTAVGAAVGVGMALLAGRLLESLLYGVGVRDASVFGGALAALTLAALLACAVPTWRAGRVEPAETLRES
jgi:putative ABC transport system permease protein